MAADQEPAPQVDGDPSTASDAVSLHTIAEADLYATQEQEDADFALALALEEQENQRYARTQRILQGRDPNQINAPAPPPVQPETPPPPYRDDPEAPVASEGQDSDVAPYRDDPNAEPTTDEAAEAATEPVRQRAFVRILRKLFKTWLCCLMCSTITTIVIIIVVFVLTLVYGTKVGPEAASKEAAWLASRSQDYHLELPKLYPALETGTQDDCKKVWERAAANLACHRMILSPAWDNGNPDEVTAAGANPFEYAEAVCTNRCQSSIRRMEIKMMKACKIRTDRFDFASYGNDGKAYFEKGKIEEGPMHVAKNLLERFDRFCARPQRRQRNTEWGTCAADLWMKWGIVDGKNEAHMNGMEQFMRQTSRRKTIPAERRTVTIVSSTGRNKTYTVNIPSRKVGPGDGETDCNSCTLDWLERKLRSFEFGQILDPATGKALGLQEFRDMIDGAFRRCSVSEARRALSNVDKKWTEFGWWCRGKPCRKYSYDPKFSETAQALLHGFKDGRPELNAIRNMMDAKDAPKEALQALYDGLRDMPCFIPQHELLLTDQNIMSHEHIVKHICSAECRNAFDRLLQQHGSLFASLVNNPRYGPYFQYPTKATALVNKVCLSSTPNAVLQSSENLCAPGYAAVGHPDWIFEAPSSRPAILAAFSAEIDALAARLPRQIKMPRPDLESTRIQSKKLAESACNTCAGGIFIGSEPNWKKTVDEYLDDESVNGTEYVAAAKKGWLTCGKMYGYKFSDSEKRALWKLYGLDRYD